MCVLEMGIRWRGTVARGSSTAKERGAGGDWAQSRKALTADEVYLLREILLG